jgi:hypothetical protein
MSEFIKPMEAADASVIRGAKEVESVNLTGKYTAKCFDVHGNLKWEEEFDNLVTTQGKNHLLNTYLASNTYSAVAGGKVFLGMISSTSYTAVAATDTANSHTGWTEFFGYSQPARPQPTFSVAASGSKATSTAAVYSITSANTVKGTFLMANNNTGAAAGGAAKKGGYSGVLYSAGLFTGGDKTIASGDVVNITYTASA